MRSKVASWGDRSYIFRGRRHQVVLLLLLCWVLPISFRAFLHLVLSFPRTLFAGLGRRLRRRDLLRLTCSSEMRPADNFAYVSRLSRAVLRSYRAGQLEVLSSVRYLLGILYVDDLELRSRLVLRLRPRRRGRMGFHGLLCGA
ncbi:hypothetical protein Bca4012_066327 [Brassica carinata]